MQPGSAGHAHGADVLSTCVSHMDRFRLYQVLIEGRADEYADAGL
jgi:hypothetical protein